MGKKNITVDYYTVNANDYILSTENADMSVQYDIFEKYLKIGDKILEIGFGGGRDFIYFSKKYIICGIDITANFVSIMQAKGYDVHLQSAENFHFDTIFDGVWANASLLHVKSEDLHDVFVNIYNHLKTGGVLYCSFKYGEFEGERNSRYFTDMNEKRLSDILAGIDFEVCEKMITHDVRPDRDDVWLNVVLKKVR